MQRNSNLDGHGHQPAALPLAGTLLQGRRCWRQGQGWILNESRSQGDSNPAPCPLFRCHFAQEDWIAFKRPLARFEEPELFGCFVISCIYEIFWPNLSYLCCGSSGLVLCHIPHTSQFYCGGSAVLQHFPAGSGSRLTQTGWIMTRRTQSHSKARKGFVCWTWSVQPLQGRTG